MKPFLTYLDNWFNIHNTNTLNIDDRINQIKQKGIFLFEFGFAKQSPVLSDIAIDFLDQFC